MLDAEIMTSSTAINRLIFINTSWDKIDLNGSERNYVTEVVGSQVWPKIEKDSINNTLSVVSVVSQ